MSDKLRYCKTFHGIFGVRGAKISDKLKLRLTCAGFEPLLVQPAEKEKKNENSTLEEASGKETRTLEDASRRGEGKAEPSLLGRRRSNASHWATLHCGVVWCGVAEHLTTLWCGVVWHLTTPLQGSVWCGFAKHSIL